MKTLIIYKSIHLGSTKKIAESMAEILKADLKEPNEIDLSKIGKYDQIGFGSGIYSAWSTCFFVFIGSMVGKFLARSSPWDYHWL